eukprot:Hpha_TRINITY_DN35651_c0_g1::TRINITY_DN35651_c0_g1_i1::g.68510::m.68510
MVGEADQPAASAAPPELLQRTPPEPHQGPRIATAPQLPLGLPQQQPEPTQEPAEGELDPGSLSPESLDGASEYVRGVLHRDGSGSPVRQSLDRERREGSILLPDATLIAVREADAASLEAQLERHDVNLSDAMGWTALHHAALQGLSEIVALLIQFGASVNRGTRGMSERPLHIASSRGHLEVCKLLRTAGADVEARNAYGDAALHCAAAGGHKEVVEWLLDNGADPAVENAQRLTADEVAAGSGAKALAAVISAACGQTSTARQRRLLRQSQAGLPPPAPAASPASPAAEHKSPARRSQHSSERPPPSLSPSVWSHASPRSWRRVGDRWTRTLSPAPKGRPVPNHRGVPIMEFEKGGRLRRVSASPTARCHGDPTAGVDSRRLGERVPSERYHVNTGVTRGPSPRVRAPEPFYNPINHSPAPGREAPRVSNTCREPQHTGLYTAHWHNRRPSPSAPRHNAALRSSSAPMAAGSAEPKTAEQSEWHPGKRQSPFRETRDIFNKARDPHVSQTMRYSVDSLKIGKAAARPPAPGVDVVRLQLEKPEPPGWVCHRRSLDRTSSRGVGSALQWS